MSSGAITQTSAIRTSSGTCSVSRRRRIFEPAFVLKGGMSKKRVCHSEWSPRSEESPSLVYPKRREQKEIGGSSLRKAFVQNDRLSALARRLQPEPVLSAVEGCGTRARGS